MKVIELKIKRLLWDRAELRRIDKSLRRQIKDESFLIRWNDLMHAALNENWAKHQKLVHGLTVGGFMEQAVGVVMGDNHFILCPNCQESHHEDEFHACTSGSGHFGNSGGDS